MALFMADARWGSGEGIFDYAAQARAILRHCVHQHELVPGGQKAKLMFLMMANANANVLLLDEPTRNISPLSGPVIRALFAEYPGCIIAVSHDERFAREVCTRAAELGKDGLKEITNALMTH